MKIYTLFYKDTGLYNRSIFVLPNDETAKKAMKLNLMQSDAERFRNEAKDGSVEIKALAEFSEEMGIGPNCCYTVCNLKELLDDNKGNSDEVEHNDTK